jgi:glycosyltransferase involved in cell wall biosynthesis
MPDPVRQRSAASAPIRVAMVTNIPAPYRVPIYERLGADPDLAFKVFFCAGSEPDRNWQGQAPRYPHHFLPERFVTVGGRYIHLNPGMWRALAEFKPDVVITTGYNPTHLVAFAYARLHGAAHVVMTDGTAHSEGSTLTALHRLVRRVVFAGSRAFVGASQGSFDLLASYGVPRQRMRQSHLCADNAAFLASPAQDKVHDLLFCGRFVAIKNPLFAMSVAEGVARRLGRRVSLAFLGAGELEPRMREAAQPLADQLDVRFLGFAQPHELPAHYKRSRIFLFPSSWDPWGVVANEACMAGVPIVVTPEPGATGEIIRDGVNGFVRTLDVNAWVDAVCRLLSDEALYQRMSQAGPKLAAGYDFDHAAQGVKQAVLLATGKEQAA